MDALLDPASCNGEAAFDAEVWFISISVEWPRCCLLPMRNGQQITAPPLSAGRDRETGVPVGILTACMQSEPEETPRMEYTISRLTPYNGRRSARD
jgi:hypothetical protein